MSCFNSAIRIGNILSENDFDYIFLKANALYIYDNKNISMRSTSDVDIFIPKNHVLSAVKVLIEKGYCFSMKYPFNNKEWVGSLEYKPDIILKDQEGNLIEIHSSLFKPEHGIYEEFEYSFLKDNVERNLIHKNLIAPSYKNYILHIIYNYTKHSFYCSGMRYLLDISYLANTYEISWKEILNGAKKIGIEKEAKITILILKELEMIELDKIPFVEDCQEYLQPALNLSFQNNCSNNIIEFLNGTYYEKFKLVLNKAIFFLKKLSYQFNININSFYIYLFYLISMYSEIVKLYQKYMSNQTKVKYYRFSLNEKKFFHDMR